MVMAAPEFQTVVSCFLLQVFILNLVSRDPQQARQQHPLHPIQHAIINNTRIPTAAIPKK